MKDQDIIRNKSDLELHQSLIAELAKATAELRTAQADQAKAQNRLRFALVLVNELIDRTGD